MDYDSNSCTKYNRSLIWSKQLLLGFLFWLIYSPQLAAASETALYLWANEVIVTAYTLSANNILARQKDLAKYFTTKAWIEYTKAVQTAKLSDSIQKNNYTVSAVALLPPTIQVLHEGVEWQATMPLLVLYKNKDYQQKQTLEVVVTMVKAQANEGVRGLAATSFTTTTTAAPCNCTQLSRTKTIV